MKILNLYAGIGGNRKLWGNKYRITAIELNPDIAKIYQGSFPGDNVIITDAHQYLLEHFEEYDFIWSSPPCQSHSRARFWSRKNDRRVPRLYPDMKLYEEIIFLKHYFEGAWVVENVISYYKPLVEPQRVGRHFFWANFTIPQIKHRKSDIHKGTIESWQKNTGLNITGRYVGQRKDQILRSCVEPELGKHILNCAINKMKKSYL